MKKVMFTSNSSEWETPKKLFNRLDKEFHFDLDPCATPKNAKCRRFFTKQDDGLTKSWCGSSVFMNPPYGRVIGQWMRKAYTQSQINNKPIVCLIPARTDTQWWHDYVIKADEIWFVRGRIHFVGGKSGAPFPSAIVVFWPALTPHRNGQWPMCKSWVL